MTYRKPLPQPNADDRFFWEGCKRHQLLFQKCRDCGHVRWPAAIFCPQCHSDETEVITSAGKGILYTYAVYHRAYHPGFADDIPYVTAVVALDEGPHLLSNLVGYTPDALKCDMPLLVVWEDITPDFALPKFRPA